MTDNIDKFCRVLKSLINLYEIHSTHPGKVSDTRRARLFLGEFPSVAVEEIGPVLYKLRDHIAKGDADTLFNLVENSDYLHPEVAHVFGPIKSIWYKHSDEKLKKDVIVSVKKLLRIYLDILS